MYLPTCVEKVLRYTPRGLPQNINFVKRKRTKISHPVPIFIRSQNHIKSLSNISSINRNYLLASVKHYIHDAANRSQAHCQPQSSEGGKERPRICIRK